MYLFHLAANLGFILLEKPKNKVPNGRIEKTRKKENINPKKSIKKIRKIADKYE